MQLRAGNLELHTTTRRLRLDGTDIRIGGRAFDLLKALIERRHRVVTTDELQKLVWPGLAVEPNNLQVQIWALRRLLGPESIITIPRRGYRFAADAMTSMPASWQADDRSRLIEQVLNELAVHRLVTLIGVSSTARQALATAICARAIQRFPAGAWQIESADLPALETSLTAQGNDDPAGEDGPWVAPANAATATDAASAAGGHKLDRPFRRHDEALLIVTDPLELQASSRASIDHSRQNLPALRLLVIAGTATYLSGERVLSSDLPAQAYPVTDSSPNALARTWSGRSQTLRWHSRSR